MDRAVSWKSHDERIAGTSIAIERRGSFSQAPIAFDERKTIRLQTPLLLECLNPAAAPNRQMTSGILIPESTITSSSGGPITVDTIEVSAVTIPSVELKDFNGVFSYASSKAKNVEIDIQLSICSTFSGVVCVPWPICCIGVCGGISIPSFTQTSNIGDITMGAGSFCMASPTVDFGPFSMTIPPLGGATPTTVAQFQVTDVCMECTVVPMPNPLGITLGDSFPVPNPMGPMNVSIEQTQIGELDSIKIATPPATVSNIKALKIKIPSVTTKPINIASSTTMSVNTSMPLYGGGIVRTGKAECAQIDTNVTLNVSSVVLKIKGGIEFTDLQGTVTTSSASSGAFDINLDLKGIKIKGLSLHGLNMPEIEVEL
jgi:hypothetical protein